MTISSSTSISKAQEPGGSPTIYHVSAPTANTEVLQALPDGTKQVEVVVESLNASAQFAYTATESGTDYFIIPAGTAHKDSGLNLINKTLYIQTDKNSQTIIVKVWV